MTDFIEKIQELLKFYEQENSLYTASIRGKNVAIVGPSQTAVGLKQGKLIDDCDYVARLNTVIDHYPLAQRFHEDMGTRTNIIYAPLSAVNSIIVRLEYDGKTIGDEYEKRLKMVLSTEEIQWIIYSSAIGPSLAIKMELFIRQHNINVGLVNALIEEYHKLWRSLFSWCPTAQPRRGFLSILDAFLRGAIVHIFGMTFYHGGGNIFRANAVMDVGPQDCYLGNNSAQFHNSTLELNYLRELKKIFPDRIVVYEELDKILNKGKI